MRILDHSGNYEERRKTRRHVPQKRSQVGEKSINRLYCFFHSSHHSSRSRLIGPRTEHDSSLRDSVAEVKGFEVVGGRGFWLTSGMGYGEMGRPLTVLHSCPSNKGSVL